jgi:integrase
MTRPDWPEQNDSTLQDAMEWLEQQDIEMHGCELIEEIFGPLTDVDIGTEEDGLDWAIGYPEAALIRSSLSALEPGWAKVAWGSVRQVVAEARRLDCIDAETAANVFELPAPRGSGGNRGRTPTDEEVAELLATCAEDRTLRGRSDAAVIAVLAGGSLRRAEASALKADDFDEPSGMLPTLSGQTHLWPMSWPFPNRSRRCRCRRPPGLSTLRGGWRRA